MYLLLALVACVVIGFFIVARMAKQDDIEEKQTMTELNCGHQIWCTAGVEKNNRCSCSNVPYYFTLHDVEQRHETIRRLAAAGGK